MRGGKYYFSVEKRDGSLKRDRRPHNAPSKKIITAKRKTVRRPNNFKTDDWYKKAAVSMAIRRQPSW